MPFDRSAIEGVLAGTLPIGAARRRPSALSCNQAPAMSRSRFPSQVRQVGWALLVAVAAQGSGTALQAGDDPAAKKYGTASTAPRNLADEVGLQFGPDTTVITGPLTAEGLPDYLGSLNRKLGAGIAPAENFWAAMWPAIGNAEQSSPGYLRAVGEMLGVEIPLESKIVEIARLHGVTHYKEANPIYDQQSKAMAAPWKRSDCPAVVRWLDAHAAMMQTVEAAARRPKAFAPLVSETEPFLIFMPLPHIQQARPVARLFLARAMLRLEEGETAGAWNDLMTVYRISKHVESGPTLVERLVAAAIRSMAGETMAQWLARADLSARELETRWRELAPLLKTESFAGAIEVERLMFADAAISIRCGHSSLQQLQESQMMFGRWGNADRSWLESAGIQAWDGTEKAITRLAITTVDIGATLRIGNGVYDDIVVAMSPESHRERAGKLAEVDKQIAAMTASIRGPGGVLGELLLAPREEAAELPGKLLVSIMTQGVTRSERAQTSSEARSATLETAFRLRIAGEKTGRLPTSAEELTEAGAAPPVDPFTGKPLLLRLDGRGVVISSVGPNGKDEQGRDSDEQKGADDLRTILVLP